MARELKIRITGDSSGLRSATDDSVGILEGFSSKVSAISVAAGNLLADGIRQGFGAISGFAKGSIGAASDLNETVSKVGVLFGDAAPQIEAFAAKAATSLGQSKQQAMDAAATFATFGKSAGLTGKDLATFSTDLTGLASDMASFSNTTPDDAIQAIGAALRGEAEPIRRYGVLLDDAAMRQKAMALGIISSTKEALTPQQKVLAAQALILEQTSAAQGDFARTSDGLANKQRILAAQLDNLKTTVGQAFLPAVLTVTTAISTKLMPVLEKWAPIISTELVGGFRAFADAFRAADGDVTSAGFPGIMERIGYFTRVAYDNLVIFAAKVADFASAVWTHAQPALMWIADHFSEIQSLAREIVPPLVGALGALMAFNKVQAAAQSFMALLGPLKALGAFFVANPIALAVAAIVGGLVLAYTHSERFKEAVDRLAGRFLGFVEAVRAAFERGGIGEAFRVALDGIKSALGDLWQWFLTTAVPAMGGWIDTATAYLSAHLPGWLATLGDWINNTVLPWLGEKASALAQLLGGWIEDAAKYLRERLPEWLGTFTQWAVGTALPEILIHGSTFAFALSDWVGEAGKQLLYRLPGWIWEFGKWVNNDAIPQMVSFGADIAINLVEGLVRGLFDAAPKLYRAVRRFIDENIPGPVKFLLGIDSPSKVFAGFGRNIAQGLALGMVDGAGLVADAAGGLAVAATPTIDMTGTSSFGTAGTVAFAPSAASAGVGGTMTINITTGADPQAVVTAIKTYVRQNGSTPW